MVLHPLEFVATGELVSGTTVVAFADVTMASPSWTTNTTVAAKLARVGNMAFFRVRISLSGAPDVASLSFQLPAGMTFNSAQLSGQPYVGYGCVVDATIYKHTCIVINSGSATCLVYYQSSASAIAAVTKTAPITWANTDDIYLDIGPVPITEWS